MSLKYAFNTYLQDYVCPHSCQAVAQSQNNSTCTNKPFRVHDFTRLGEFKFKSEMESHKLNICYYKDHKLNMSQNHLGSSVL